jgi:hypothetical protein
MNASGQKSRGAAFWLLIVGGVLLGCCGLPTLGVLILGALSGSAGPATAAADSPAAANPGGDEPDDFISRLGGGNFIASSRVSAEGVSVTMAGEWRDDHRNLILRLRGDGRYELADSGGYLSGKSSGTASGSRSAEAGEWALEGTTLTLTPGAREVGGSVGGRKVDTTAEQVEGPRQWSVVGVTIEYTRYGEQEVRHRPGLHVRGPAPAWYYPSGEMDWTLRSAPWSGD